MPSPFPGMNPHLEQDGVWDDSRVEHRPRIDVWPIRLRECLPTIPVPVRSGHPDAVVDFQEVLNTVYDEAEYACHIYSGEPEPPLSPEDAEWARQFVPAPKRPAD